ncbi:SRPBCC domain-containing protein [Nitriliruptor alkaliphilus]|uniref:SRPBCC domain-containing protein n=1 Tax=Nitriliruptor alkaliphilus TaxID=427918 RepID=UPI0006976664|nr:SRPBCC domain-containing protein [Nitriliruptor alkaliphilus]
MTTTPTGTVTRIDGQLHLLHERRFRARPEDVWRALTEQERLERWIGTWEGDPAEGHVTFRMTAEGDDVAAERIDIRTCDAPRRFEADFGSPAGVWRIGFTLSAEEGGTRLRFTQGLRDADEASSSGPGWEYYLDRAVQVVDHDDTDFAPWSDYEPMADHFVAATLRAEG